MVVILMIEKLKAIKEKFLKVSIKDRNLWREYSAQVAIISSVVTIISFCAPSSSSWKWRIGSSILFIFFLMSLFIYDWYRANQTQYAYLKINGTNVNVQIGDIFDQEGIKIIGVNNYIDLVADDVIIAKATLHGQFIMRHENEIDEIKKAINTSSTLILEDNSDRSDQQSYDYGSCVLYKDFILTVLTKFDLKNKAYTSIQEYIQFWMTFWTNIDVLYNSRTINIPILGAGQTRFRGIKPEKQELIEIGLWTLKESGFHNNYSDKSINFIIYEGDVPEIDFYRIQKTFQ